MSAYMFGSKLFQKSLPFLIPITVSCLYCNDSLNNLSYSFSSKFNVLAESLPDEDIEQISHYKKLSYPARFAVEEIRKFQNLLESMPRHKEILILGSSPELRDIAFLANKNVTIVDTATSKMNLFRDKCMKHGKMVKLYDTEELIEGDILKMDENDKLKDREFDIILCEYTLNRVAFNDWENLTTQLFELLEENGFIIMKVLCIPPKNLVELVTIEDIVDDWIQSIYGNINDVGVLFIRILTFLYAWKQSDNESDDEYQGSFNWNEVMKYVENRSKQYNWNWTDQQRNKFFDIFTNIKDQDFVFYSKMEERMSLWLAKDKFYFQDTFYGGNDRNKFCSTPIYVLGKQGYRIGGIPGVPGFTNDKWTW